MSEKKENIVQTNGGNDSNQGGTLPLKRVLHSIEQWSQDENCGEDILPCDGLLTNGHTSAKIYKEPMSQFSKNNNLVEEEINLGCDVDKCSYYKNFTLKVNNNIYPEQSNQNKDGMEEYFMVNSKNGKDNLKLNGTSEKEKPNGNETYYSQINALNREYDDEEEDDAAGCIYTYKGDNYESNLSHLFDTCHSCGLPTIARIGSSKLTSVSINPPPLVQSNPQNNLYSPEMDFLEMDFDPGSNGEGPDSECEDNNLMNNISNSNENGVGINNAGGESSIFPYICQQCEQSALNDKKLNNLTENQANGIAPTNCEREPMLDIENALSNNDMESFKEIQCANGELEDKQSPVMEISNKPAEENNLDCDESSSDDSGDADDERDDSTSEQLPKEEPLKRKSSLFYPHRNRSTNLSLSKQEEDGSLEIVQNYETNPLVEVVASVSSNVVDDESQFKANNDLGSISAPEVSPTKEFSSLEKLSRSLSFHNQLSSPKYENVCSGRLKEVNTAIGLYGDPDICGCQSQNNPVDVEAKELLNIQFCTDRLNQRLRSVFNIGSDQTDDQIETVGSTDHKQIGSACSWINIPQEECHDIGTTPHNIQENEDVRKSVTLRFKGMHWKSEGSSDNANLDEQETNDVLCEPTTQIEKVMIWTEPQASFRQITQLGTSACGPTAVVNVFLALDHAIPVSSVTNTIKARLRAENGPLVEYLFSRCNAGTTHEDLIRGVEELSKGSITSRFFHMYPKRSFQLSRWLSYWIRRGGVPVATLNLQVAVDPRQTVPDAWHHQMVFGVGPRGVYLTNPLECVSDSLLSEQLCSESVLLVRRRDVVKRWNKSDQLIKLSLHSDPRWNEMNVLGQVVCVLKEHDSPETTQGRRHLTSHVAIPASYQSGITIFMRSDNPSREDLLKSPELPLLE